MHFLLFLVVAIKKQNLVQIHIKNHNTLGKMQQDYMVK